MYSKYSTTVGLFNRKKKTSITGTFIIEGETLRPLDGLPENHSIKSILESLGYSTKQMHIVLTFKSPIFQVIGFRKRTTQPIFVSTKDKDTPLSYSDVRKEINKIDWAFENRQLDFEDSI